MKCFVTYDAKWTLLDFHSHSHYEVFIILYCFMDFFKIIREKNDTFVSSKVFNGMLEFLFSPWLLFLKKKFDVKDCDYILLNIFLPKMLLDDNYKDGDNSFLDMVTRQ
jgi:hypothetical protein